MTVEIPHLVFSTRTADPRSGSEFTREIVAASPGVSDTARQELARLADMTGSTLRRPGLPPLWAFRRIDATSWLVVRAVSLGLYRKGHHQLLVHGVVLERELLDWIDANPFLLATPEAREAGFSFLEAHPGTDWELPPLRLDPDFAGTARRTNLARLAALGRELERHDEALPRLYGQVLDRLQRRTGPVIWVAGESPDPAFLEGLLFHFHPADRARLSFHTWFAYDSPQRIDLVGAAPDQVGELRRLLREVEVWPGDGTGDGAGEVRDPRDWVKPGDGIQPGETVGPEDLGRLAVALRRKDPLHFASILEEPYYLTVLPRDPLEPVGSDLRDRSLDPLSPADAAVCLLHELGEETARPLTGDESRRLDELVERSGNTLTYYAGVLARAWERSPEAFEAELARLAELPKPPADRHDLLYSHFREPTRRWALLALLRVLPDAPADSSPSDSFPSDPSLPDLRRRAWEELVPRGRLGELLERFDTPEKAALAERFLGPYVFEEARREPDPDTASWPDWLAWLGRVQRPVAPAAARIEAVLTARVVPSAQPKESERHREAALTGYRNLQKICFEAELAPFALRLLFQREAPLLDGPRRRIRVQDGLQRLLREEHADEVLGPPLQDPDTAEAIFDGLGEWIERTLIERRSKGREDPGSSSDPDAIWRRCEALLRAQKSPVTAASIPAAGRFLARLGRSPLAGRSAAAWELLAGSQPALLLTETVREIGRTLWQETAVGHAALGLASLLDARLAARLADSSATLGAGESVDRELLEVLPLALVRFEPSPEGGGESAKLRQQVDLYLDRLLAQERLAGLLLPAPGKPRTPTPGTALHDVWENVLRDEMLRLPPHEPAEDPRYRAHLLLAWNRWAVEAMAGDRRPSEVALLHAVAAGGAPGYQWHREQVTEALPRNLEPGVRARAESLLDVWFPEGRRTAA